MRIQRTLRGLVLLAIATFGLAACFGTYDPMTERELICGRTPDDLCVRVADYAMSDAANLDVEVRGSEMTVWLNRADCKTIGRGPNATSYPPAARCWRIDGDVPALSYHFGNWVYERPDGTLGVAH